MAHKTRPSTFISSYFPETKLNFWSRDVDILWASDIHFMSKLSSKSRIPFKKLRDMSLQSYSGYLSESIHTNTRNKLIVPIKNRGRINMMKGIRFCPICLKTDEQPYFRKIWRLSFITACQKHKCFLEDSCQSCQLPITLYNIKEESAFCLCTSCHKYLWESKPTFIKKNSYGLYAQNKLLTTLNSGTFIFEGCTYYSLAFFPVLNQFTKLIYNSDLHSNTLSHEVMAQDIPLPRFDNKPSLYIEDITVKEQYLIYSISVYILQGAKGIKKFCKNNHLGKGLLAHSMRYIPYWFDSILFQNDISSYSISIKEVESIIKYFKKNNFPISFQSLSNITNSTLDSRKRQDIKILIYYEVERNTQI